MSSCEKKSRGEKEEKQRNKSHETMKSCKNLKYLLNRHLLESVFETVSTECTSNLKDNGGSKCKKKKKIEIFHLKMLTDVQSIYWTKTTTMNW